MLTDIYFLFHPLLYYILFRCKKPLRQFQNVLLDEKFFYNRNFINTYKTEREMYLEEKLRHERELGWKKPFSTVWSKNAIRENEFSSHCEFLQVNEVKRRGLLSAIGPCEGIVRLFERSVYATVSATSGCLNWNALTLSLRPTAS